MEHKVDFAWILASSQSMTDALDLWLIVVVFLLSEIIIIIIIMNEYD